MARILLTATLVAAATLTAGSVRLHACSCNPYRSACSSEWNADAVFVGVVTAITQLTEPEMFGARRVTLLVHERFKGVDGRLVDVLTGSGRGDCGFNFSVGSTYVIFANRHPITGRLSTNVCSATSLANGANQDLKRLRAPVRPLLQPALVHGRVMRSDLQSIRTARVNEPTAGAQVRLVGQAGSFETRTSSDGRYEFRVPVGRYRLKVETEDRFYTYPDASAGVDVRVVEAKPCAPIDIQVKSNGRIRGRLVDTAGRGVPFLSLDLADRSRRDMIVIFPAARTITDADGHFLFDRIAPGEYSIGLTLRRYSQRPDPNYAIFLKPGVPLDVDLETNLDAGAILIPDGVDVRQITGVVVDAGGAAVANVEVRTATPGKNAGVSSEPVVTDANGRFVISGIAGRAQELVAEDRSGADGSLTYRTARSPVFDAASVQAPVRLIVK